jgi:hypothetical protein
MGVGLALPASQPANCTALVVAANVLNVYAAWPADEFRLHRPAPARRGAARIEADTSAI